MKKIIYATLSLFFLFSFSVQAGAASNYLPVESSGTKITILKNPDPASNQKAKAKKITFINLKKELALGDSTKQWVSILAQYEDNSSDYPANFTLASSNKKVMTIVDKTYLKVVGQGTAIITAKYAGQTVKQTIKVVAAPTGTVSVKNNLKNNIISYNFFYKNVYDKGNYYYAPLSLLATTNKDSISFKGIDWKKTSTVYASITTSDGSIYQMPWTVKQNNKTFSLSRKDFSKVTIKYFNKNVATTFVNANKKDSKNKPMSVGKAQSPNSNTFYIKKGTYNFQLLAKDKKNYYNIFKINTKINKASQIITITNKDVALSKISIKKYTKNTIGLQYIGTSNSNDFAVYYYLGISNSPSSANVYLPANQQANSINILVNKQYLYSYIPSSKIEKIQLSDKIKAQITFKSNRIFYTNQKIYLQKTAETYSDGTFTLKDSLGNTIESIFNNITKDMLKGNIVFKQGTQTYKQPITSYYSNSLTLPSKPGTYTVTFEHVN